MSESDWSGGECGSSGICLLEHVNFDVADSSLALCFYHDVLGMAADSNATPLHASTLWINVGQQQLHLPLAAADVNTHIDGTTGIVVSQTAFEAIRERIVAALTVAPWNTSKMRMSATTLSADELADAPADIRRTTQTYGGGDGAAYSFLDVTDPFGNEIRVHSAKVTEQPTPMPTPNSSIAERCAATSPLFNGVGIAYLTLSCPRGSSSAIAAFFKEMFAATVSVETTGATAIIQCGAHQTIYFLETSASELRPMCAGHFCFYLRQFERSFELAKGRSLLWTHADRSDFVTDMAAAKRFNQFRMTDVTSASGAVLFQCEMEIRSLNHRHAARRLL